MATDPFEELLLHAYPNPGRKGCPGSQALQAAANDSVSFDDPILQHIRSCSPCFAEFRVFRDARRDRERLSRLGAFGSIAALVIICVSAIIFYSHRKPNQGRNHVISNALQDKSDEKFVALDLRALSPTRGSEDAVGLTNAWTLPATLIRLQMNLPLGSDDGNYHLEICRGKEIVKVFSGAAVIRDGDTVLIVNSLDLSHVAQGQYSLRFAHADASWHTAVVTIR